jgi:hypothetical protein
MITLRFVTCRDVISAAIRAYQYGFWASHVEAAIGGRLIGAHLEGGVKARTPGYDAARMKREEFISIAADDAATTAFEAFLTAQIDKPYDIKAIAGMLVARDWRSPDKWFCSELVAGGFERAGVVATLPLTVTRVLPRDIRLIASALA